MANHKRYVIGTLIGAFLLIALAATFNVLVDPYAIFGAPRVAGLNDAKPYSGDRGRVGKRHQVLRIAPKGLIVGTRAQRWGCRPSTPAGPLPRNPSSISGCPASRSIVRSATHSIPKPAVPSRLW